MTHCRRFGTMCALTLFALLMTGVAMAGTTLTFLVDNIPMTVNGAQALVDAYKEKRPDITIEVEMRPSGTEGENIVKTRLATGEMTDLFSYPSGALMRALNPEKTIADLTDLSCQAGIDPGFKKVQSINGKLYSVPNGTARAGGIFYNKRVYKELGLSVPKTWPQFIDNCQKIKDAGIAVPVILSYRDT